ncbi:MAG: sugar ABC transporter permease [Oscillospiraceae bacterium]|nr:sugar ABC transporter permease [Oscillospiraceae bacterium]
MKKEQVFKTLRAYSMVIILVVIAVLFHVLTSGLIFTSMNLTNIILQNSYVVILILGMLPIILTGNIDLSVGSVLAFVGAIAAIMQVNFGCGVLATLVVSLAAGCLIGAWQGLWVAYFDIPAFIVTLSGELVFRGLTQVILDGASIGPFSDTFRAMASSFIPDFLGGNGFHVTTMVLAVIACGVFIFLQLRARRDKIAHGVPVKGPGGMIARCVLIGAVILYLSYQMATYQGYPTVLLIMLVLSLIYNFVCSRTVFGRGLYAVGGNRKAAALSGIKDRQDLFLAYTNMGLMSAVAALVYAARLNAATPKAGVNFELDAIAACFVGGASVTGGSGTIAGALVGCFVIGILNNGMSMMGISADWQQTVKGLVILAAVAFDLIPKRKKK